MAKAEINISEMQRLVEGLDDALQDLRLSKSRFDGDLTTYQIDYDLGRGVQQAIDWSDEELPGVRRRLALAEMMEMDPEPDWPAGYVELDDDTAISDVPPDQAEQNGAEAAEALQVENARDLDEDLVAEIEENMNDPYFAAGFAREASPEQLAQYMDTVDALERENYVDMELRNRLVESVGTTIGTATRNTGTLSPSATFARDWADAITGETMAEGGDNRQGQPQYLAMFLQHGRYGTPFLDHVGDELYEYERDADGAAWEPKASNAIGGVRDANGDEAVDVMAMYMSALGNNPEAAQNFFDGGNTTTVELNGQEVEVNERLQYMTTERTWQHRTDPTNGGRLGEALEAATTHFRDQSDNGRVSAKIASQTFALIGDKTGEGSSDGILGFGASEGWQMWDGMRGNVANMLASYGPDLMRLGRGHSDDLGSGWTAGPEEDLFGDGAPYGAAMDPELVGEILGTYGKDGQREHLDTVMSGVMASSQQRIGLALEESLNDGTEPSAPVAMLEGRNIPALATATNEAGGTMGWVINSAYHGALDEEELEQKQAEARAAAFDAVTSLPVVKPAGEWSKLAYEQAQSHLKNEIGNSDPSAGSDFAELSSDEKDNLDEMLLNQMLAHGYFDQEYVDEANGGGNRYEGPPEEMIDRSSDPPRFDFDHESFEDWHRNRFPMDDFLRTHIHGSFEEGIQDGLELNGR
ncbi:hypothetical protein EF847_05385 [Actinobacteria bacterium YIM 96077]|uniref:DUF6571 domain-containing protein n=1 Tax=Phytoactinopolyspora halophila TaxID=1981511 RepID=A0A329R1K2_9ACTN|nr:DUF6571 family protein [Phytoactinopolyspora halophila]AYY12223.1 hypothetical protein EF847_05385 [Actinobacteria bacterium YIM 96077]RAW18544.1 hypothetical protein DPM12_00130 [Phytoactinopolyspora halophila]